MRERCFDHSASSVTISSVARVSHPAGRDGVDPDSAGRQIDGERAGELGDRALRGVVGDLVLLADERGRRRGAHDRSAAALGHGPRGRRRHQVHAADIHVHRAVEVLERRLERVLEVRHAGVRGEDVEAAEALERLGDGPVGGLGLADVGGKSGGLAPRARRASPPDRRRRPAPRRARAARPRTTSRWAIARPIPLDPPVTIPALPSNLTPLPPASVKREPRVARADAVDGEVVRVRPRRLDRVGVQQRPPGRQLAGRRLARRRPCRPLAGRRGRPPRSRAPPPAYSARPWPGTTQRRSWSSERLEQRPVGRRSRPRGEPPSNGIVIGERWSPGKSTPWSSSTKQTPSRPWLGASTTVDPEGAELNLAGGDHGAIDPKAVQRPVDSPLGRRPRRAPPARLRPRFAPWSPRPRRLSPRERAASPHTWS